MTNNKSPALLDFYADWCGPCKAMNPTIEALKAKYGEALEVKKINVDEQSDVAQMYGVRSIPTLVFLNSDGVEVARGVGARPQALIEKTIDEIIEKEKGEKEKLTAG
jgi:thioredoxin